MYQADLIDATEEMRRPADIDRVEFAEVRFRGVVANRTVADFGVDYDYATGAVTGSGSLPAWLTWLRDRCGDFGGVEPTGWSRLWSPGTRQDQCGAQ